MMLLSRWPLSAERVVRLGDVEELYAEGPGQRLGGLEGFGG